MVSLDQNTKHSKILSLVKEKINTEDSQMQLLTRKKCRHVKLKFESKLLTGPRCSIMALAGILIHLLHAL